MPAPSSLYLDHAASSALRPVSLEAMTRAWALGAGNPASTHHAGRRQRRILEDAREQVAHLLGAFADEVIFTSGATESNNLALTSLGQGIRRASQSPCSWVLSPIEHASVRQPVEGQGEPITWVKPETTGVIETSRMAESMRGAPWGVATLQMVNQETGALQPVMQLGEQIEREGAVWKLHTDATQAVGKVPVLFHRLRVATLSASAHKFGGPVGVGLLLARRGTSITPLQRGGGQQTDRRAGTESAALAVALAAALAESLEDRNSFLERSRSFRDLFLQFLSQSKLTFHLNSPESGLPHLVNLSFPGVRSDTLLMALDLAGVAVSAGSACSSGSILPSAVLSSMGLARERVESAIRISWGWDTTQETIEEAARRIVPVVQKLQMGSANP